MTKRKLTKKVFIKSWLHWYKKSTDLKYCKEESFDLDCSFCQFVGYTNYGPKVCINCPAYGLWSTKTTCLAGEWGKWHIHRTRTNARQVLKVIEKAYLKWEKEKN